MSYLRLVKFIDSGRGGDLEGLTVYDEADWAQLQKFKDDKTEIFLGEVLGKHSQVFVTLDDNNIQVESEDQIFLNKLIKVLGWHLSGIYLYDYLDPE